jgi:hypothetical protein
MLTTWCVATACGRIGYDYDDLNGTTLAGGGSSGAGGSGGSAGANGGTGGASGGGAQLDSGLPCSQCGPVLYWKFDEASGTQALDSSGNGLDGIYIALTQPPAAPSTLVPPKITFPDPASRQFTAGSRHAVQLANAPAIVKPPNNITLGVWYRSGGTDLRGEELIDLGENYLLRLDVASNGTIELTKLQPQLVDGGFSWIGCAGVAPGYLDFNWHHVAGVISSSGMKLYFDGTVIATNPDGTDIAYSIGSDLFVGRHGSGITKFDFGGNIDDVRIYARALSDAEVQQLAQGGP